MYFMSTDSTIHEDDKNQECPIELYITHNFEKDHVWYPEHSTHLLIQIYDTMTHELITSTSVSSKKF